MNCTNCKYEFTEEDLEYNTKKVRHMILNNDVLEINCRDCLTINHYQVEHSRNFWIEGCNMPQLGLEEAIYKQIII